MIRAYAENNVRETVVMLNPKNRKWEYENKEDIGKPAFERCVENNWLIDKVSSIDEDMRGTKLVDFGCNKAEYISLLKKKHGFITYGIDLKKGGSKYVDKFFFGEYNDKIEKKLESSGPYKIATSISSVEHSGFSLHPDKKAIDTYQKRICKALVNNSDYFFLSVPFGKRPGWAKDKSRKNLYQFDTEMLDFLSNISSNKQYLEEVYRLDGRHWVKSDRKTAKDCIYRNKKQGATAIALISIWKD